MTLADALAKLKILVAWQSEPALSEGDLTTHLSDNLRYVDYPGTGQAVVIDTVVRPSGSRRTYQCVTAGTTAGALSTPLDTFLSNVVSDGTVLWQDAGPVHKDNYDVRGAARAAWLQKAALASELVNTKSPGQSADEEQIYKHCVSMADRYAPSFVA